MPRINTNDTPRTSTLPAWLAVVMALAVLGFSVLYLYFTVFSLSSSPDEGYLMITIQSYLAGHPLYDVVFTQYGPFYYCYQALVRLLVSLPLTHDATRLFCMFHWLLASALLGLAAARLFRSRLAGLFVFGQAIVHLTSLANEPGHPQEVLAVLLALAILIAVQAKGRWTLYGTLGAIGGMIAFTKINVGAFFVLALLLAIYCQSDSRFRQGIWPWVLALLCAALPPLLMRQHLAVPWCRNHCLILAVTLATTLVVANRFSVLKNRNNRREEAHSQGKRQKAEGRITSGPPDVGGYGGNGNVSHAFGKILRVKIGFTAVSAATAMRNLDCALSNSDGERIFCCIKSRTR